MALPSKRVLLTGATGFTGHYLVPALRQAGWQVYGLSPETGGELADWELAADLLDPAALTQAIAQCRPDAVIHLAAIAFVAHADPLDFYRVNMFGTLNLLTALQASGLTLHKVIVASSANIYGNPVNGSADDVRFDEGQAPAPVNHYAMSKLAMEHMVRSYFAGLPVLMTRPFNYTGVGQDKSFLVPKIVDHFRRAAPFIELGNLDVARDFLDVRDVARAYVQLLDSPLSSGTVNICSGDALPLTQLLNWAQEITSHRIDVRVNPSLVRAQEIKRLSGDNTRLLAQGWTKKYTFADTLRWMLTAP